MTNDRELSIRIFPVGLEASRTQRTAAYLFHPDYPDVVIKDCGGVEDVEDVVQTVLKARRYVGMLAERYGIAHADTEFVIGRDGTPGSNRIFAVAKRISGIPIEEAMHSSSVSDDARDEAEILTGRILNHLSDVVYHGGEIDYEVLQYRQYMFDGSAAKGARAVLVDIEPCDPLIVTPPVEGRSNFDVNNLLATCAYVASQIVALEKDRPCTEVRLQLLRVLEGLVGDSSYDFALRAKQLIQSAITIGNEGIVSDYFELEDTQDGV